MMIDRRMGSVFRVALVTLVLLAAASHPSVGAAPKDKTRFRRIPTQYIAALAAPTAKSGREAHTWGLWPLDPGPRGVWLDGFEKLKANNNTAPAKWTFDSKDWWLEEHGLIMEKPVFPLQPGKYLVTGDREVTTVLTVYPRGADGTQRWELADNATLYDVTHLACRSARYTPKATLNACSPAKAPRGAFPVAPGGVMPPVDGCDKQDYAVLIVIGVPVENE